MKNKKRKNLILIIVINVLLTITKFFIILDGSARTFLSDDVIYFAKRPNYIPIIISSIVALVLDFLINYLVVRISSKKYGNEFKYYKVIIIPIVVTIFFIIIGIF